MAAQKNSAAGSPEQLSGDFYAACMDETKVNELGAKPVQPLLDEVHTIKNKADVQRTIGHLHDLGVAVPFGVFERRVDKTAIARIVDQHHRGNRDATKHIQRQQAF